MRFLTSNSIFGKWYPKGIQATPKATLSNLKVNGNPKATHSQLEATPKAILLIFRKF